MFDDINALAEQEGVYQVMKRADQAFKDGRFDEVDHAVARLDFTAIKPAVLVSFAVIGFWAKAKMKNRVPMFNRIEAELLKQLPARRVKRILEGLRPT